MFLEPLILQLMRVIEHLTILFDIKFDSPFAYFFAAALEEGVCLFAAIDDHGELIFVLSVGVEIKDLEGWDLGLEEGLGLGGLIDVVQEDSHGDTLRIIVQLQQPLLKLFLALAEVALELVEQGVDVLIVKIVHPNNDTINNHIASFPVALLRRQQ
jgi:hypothetical protein